MWVVLSLVALVAFGWWNSRRNSREFDAHCIVHTPKGYKPGSTAPKWRLWILLLLTLGFNARAQQVWDYSDGNSLFDSTITFASALPQNGTVDITPTSFNIAGIWGFTVPSIGFLTEAPGGAQTFQITTTNGQITAFDIGFGFTTQGTNSPTTYDVTISSQGDSYFQQTNGFQCEGGPPACAAIIATSAPGTWTDPHAAPEMDMLVAITGITLLFGCVAILKGKS
jgi:hypothetical protein